jgi:phage tail sheath protein FI
VFIEEVPARLKAIEGVSTSTFGIVGMAERGPVAGFPLPFNGAAQNFAVPVDPAPVLVTSFADFTRTFGNPLPLPDPNHHGYLARSVKGFFENGGKRCFVARVVDIDTSNPANPTSTAVRTQLTIGRGVRHRLARRSASGQTVVTLTSLRGINSTSTLEFRSLQDPGTIVQSVAIAPGGISPARGEVTLAAALAQNVDPNDIFITLQGVAFAATGPRFHARSPGLWSSRIRIGIANVDRGPVPVVSPAPNTSTQIRVASVASFYRGAIIEITDGATRVANEVAEILPGNILSLQAATGVALTGTATDFAQVVEIDVTVTDDSGPEPVVETFRALTWNQRNEPDIRVRHYATVINGGSRLVYVQPPGVDGLAGTESADLAGQPVTEAGFPIAMADNAGGDADGANGNPPTDDDYVGVDNGPGLRTGVQSLQDMEDIRIIAAPGRFNAVVQNALIAQCERMRYRFAVLDGEENPAGGSVNSVLAHRNLYDTSFASYYTPWLEVIENGQRLRLPASGHVAGIYARTDVERGVWKAPANEVVRGIVGLRSYITTGEQEILNPRGVNCIRRFEGRGLRVWGARTLSSDPEYRYTNVRRFLIYLEASIDRGTQYVVFEPNAPPTWSRVVDSISAFLHTQWREGALFGRRPEDAFFVRCDETTMTADDIQNGRLICLIGVAIVRPAEFVIFRIQQITGFGNES